MEFLRNKNILIISPESWGKSMVSKHHYAATLVATGNKVWFLQADVPHASTESGIDGLTVLTDTFHLRGTNRLPSWLRRPLVKRSIRNMEKAAGVSFDVVWSFDNSRYFDLNCFDSAYKIHHMMDFHVDYHNDIASSEADLCLGVTSGIVDKMRSFNKRSYFINHGYTPTSEKVLPLPSVKEKYIALYTGNLLMHYVNWPWLISLVKENRDTHFFLAGSYAHGSLNPEIFEDGLQSVMQISKEENVTLLGERSPVEIQGLMLDADVLYFAYLSNKFPEILANSHKLMAYLGSGKPVVCHTVKEYISDDPLIYMSSTLEEYIATFRRVIHNLDHFNSEELVQKRKTWALNNTYLKQLERIDKLILAE